MPVNLGQRWLKLKDRCHGQPRSVLQARWAPVVFLMVLAACAPAAAPTSLPAPIAASPGSLASGWSRSAPTAAPDGPLLSNTKAVPASVPTVDTSLHNVPLEDIVFDTFGGSPRFVPLSRAGEELIRDPRDAISPVAKPVYGGPDSLPWLDDTHLGMGYRSGDSAFAYPVNILNRHEIVNDVIDGVPLVVTYCPLCFSGVVFSRQIGDGLLLTFGNTSAFYQSDMVMYDHQTGSYWFQVGGEAVVGPMTGSRLDLLPSTTMEWGDWRRLNPETQVLIGTDQEQQRFTGRRYQSGMPANYQRQINRERFAFPVDESKLDGRLAAGEIVVTVEAGNGAKANLLGLIGDGAVNESVAGIPVVVFVQESRRAVAVYSPTVDGMTLIFEFSEDRQAFVDRSMGSVLGMGGVAFEGPLAGAGLTPLNTRRAFWFSIPIAFPGIDVYLP